MAHFAYRTPTPVVQLQALLRPAVEGPPPLLPAGFCAMVAQNPVVATKAKTSARNPVCSTAERTLLPPAPLPSLTAAFSRRRAIFGPVPLTNDGEVRALELHDVVPAGHIAVPITNARWAPHLKTGEFAIIDVSDTEPQTGELYGLTVGSRNGPKLHIVQPFRWPVMEGSDGVMFRFGQPKPGTVLATDGPLRRDHWHRTCRGRVVGVLALAEVARG